MTLGKGANANVVKTVVDGGLFASKGVGVGWTIVRVNRTVVDSKSAFSTLKEAMKQGGTMKVEFQVPFFKHGG